MGKNTSTPIENTISYGETLNLKDFKVSGSEYGRSLPIVFGTAKVPGNLVWLSPIKEHQNVSVSYQSTEMGKKGGSQTSSQTTITYSYTADFVAQFCIGPALGVRKIWLDKQLVYSVDVANQLVFKFGEITIYLGTSSQTMPSPVPTSYRDTVCIHFQNFKLTKFGNRVPSIEVEVVTAGTVGGTGIITPGDVSAVDVITRICQESGLAPTDFDIVDLTADFTGYQVPLGDLLRAIDPVVTAAQAAAIYSDDKIKFKALYVDPVVTIPIGDLRFAENSGNNDAVKMARANEKSLPSSVIVTYLDKDRDHDVNSQATQINDAKVINERDYGLSIGLTANNAARLSETLLYTQWNARTTYEFTLGSKYLYLEPGDAVIVETDSGNKQMLITQMDVGANDIIEVKAKNFNKNTLVSNRIGSSFLADQYAEPAITDTTFQFFNAPLVLLEHNEPGVFIGVSGVTPDAWYYTTVYKSYNAVNYTQQKTYQSKGIFGSAATVLADAVAQLPDYINTVDIVINAGQLLSTTMDEVLSDPTKNLFFIGDELVQAVNVTLIGVLTYRLSTLLRGRFGTEKYTAGHIASEKVGYYPSLIYMPLVSDNDYNSTLYLKLVSNGQVFADIATVHSFVSDYRTLIPYSPVKLDATKPAADILITWVRRSRYGNELATTGAEVMLFELSESYQVDILSPLDVVVRTIAVTNQQSAIYTAAMQVADFGGVQTSIRCRVCQVSDTVGRGTLSTQLNKTL